MLSQSGERTLTCTIQKARITLPDGTVRDGQFGWEDEQGLPDVTVVQQWVQDDTLPTGPYRKERRWMAPFTRASREGDYRMAWAFCEAQAGVQMTSNNPLPGLPMLPSPLARDIQCHTICC